MIEDQNGKPLGNNGGSRMNRWLEKITAWSVAIVIAFVGFVYSDINRRIITLEERTTFLSQDKVSRNEFREEMYQFRKDIFERQDTLKSDILSRLDFLVPQIKNKKQHEE